MLGFLKGLRDSGSGGGDASPSGSKQQLPKLAEGGSPTSRPAGDKVGASSQLPEGGRLHVKVQERYVTLLRLKGELFAIDSVCFHAGGPLGIGDIEDLGVGGESRTCIVCPWHYYKIDVASGDKYYQGVNFVNGKMVQGDWKTSGVKQRVHKLVEQDGWLYVELNAEGKVESDEYACSGECGSRVINAPKTRLHSTSVGGDGKKPSGSIIQQARESAEKSALGPGGGLA